MSGFKSFLSAVGHDFVAVFKWLGSTQGQQAVQVAEGTAVTVGTIVGGPALGIAITGVEGLINVGLRAVLQMEASASAVGAQSGTGAQKGAAVVALLVPQATQLLKDLGVTNPTVEQGELLAAAIADGLVGIVNKIPAPTAA
jgi:hypothetical protein